MAAPRPDRTRGPIHDEFWAACARGTLSLQRCQTCGHRPWPAAPSCEHCGGTDLVWQRVSGRGTVVSWCAFVQDYYRGTFALPHDCILVALEEGPLFISNPQGFSFDDMVPNMQVQVAFVDCEDSTGPFKLPVFTKA